MILGFKNKSRTGYLAVSILGVFAVIVIRLFFLQVIEGADYRARADKGQRKQFEIKAQRGLIYAMDGKKLTKMVLNETVYTLWIDPQEVANSKKVKKNEIISEFRKIAGGNLRDDFEKLFEKTSTRYQVIGTKLSLKQANAIREKKFHGVGFTAETRRVYPEGNLAAQVLGFVNDNGGNYGIEQAMNKELTGTDGYKKITTDAFNQVIEVGSENIEKPALNGKNIALSIDRNIQARVEKVLKSQMESKGMKNGSVLVMNPKNGKIMAMANYPTYNPANYGKVEKSSVYNNNTATMAYENGSVIKSFTMATGINEGVASPSTRYNNTDSIRIEDIVIQNAVLGHTGSITLQTAMNYSLNTGMVTIGKLLGGGSLNLTARDKIYDYFHNRFGLGQETGIEILESKGLLVSPKQAEGNAVRYSNMTFGQGMTTTMLQTANAFSSLVNGGTLYKPSVIQGIVDENGKLSNKEPEINKQAVISKETSEQMKQVLEGVRKVGGVKDPAGYQIGGKTGTSQTIVGGKYVDFQTIGSYVGFGGGDEAEYVIMVAVWGENQNLQGSKDAAPIFTEISNWLLNYLEIKPKN